MLPLLEVKAGTEGRWSQLGMVMRMNCLSVGEKNDEESRRMKSQVKRTDR